MRKNLLTIGFVTLISILLFSPRSRQTVCRTINTDSLDKAVEMKNVLADFRKNN